LNKSAGDPVNAAQQDIGEQLRSALSPGVVTARVKEIWHPYAIPLPLTEDAMAFINLKPTAAAVTDVSYGSTSATIGIALEGQAELSAQPMRSDNVQALPPLEHIASVGDEFSLAVPMKATYGELSALMTDFLRRQPLHRHTWAGDVDARIDRAELYPSGKQIVIGVHFDASLPLRPLNTKGWIYLAGTPQIDSKDRLLRLADVRFTGELDSEVWNLLSSALRQNIQTLIESKRIDLRATIDQGRAKVRGALHAFEASNNIIINLSDDDFSIDTARTWSVPSSR
jgi:hypothetical protein